MYALIVGAVIARVEASLQDFTVGDLVVPLSAFAGLLIVQQALDAITGPISTATSRRVEGWVRHRVREALASRPGIADLENPDTHNDVAIVIGGAAGANLSGTLLAVSSSVSSAVGFIASAIVIARFSIPMAVLYTTVLAVGHAWLRRRSVDIVTTQVSKADVFRRRGYVGSLHRAAAKESRVYGLSDFVLGRYREAGRTYWNAMLVAFWGRQVVQLAFIGLAVVVLFGIGIVLIRSVFAGAVTIGAATTCLLAAQSMIMWLAASFSPSALADKLFGALDRLVEGQTTRPPAHALPGRTGTELVRLEDVTFSYPGSSASVLNGIDLVIHEGESVAVVGINGAGKTSLIKLIAGLYEPGGGRILVRGEPLTSANIHSWRTHVGAVFQDFVRYPLTARMNVTLGAGRLSDDSDGIERASDAAGASEVIAALPAQWETVLSRQYEGGAELSGGQWQRIALSRAIYAAQSGASLVLLDEPTANLDVRAEYEAFDRLLHHTGGAASVIVSHRFSTVRKADRIIVLDGGRVMQDGTHAELMARGGLYRDMFLAQAGRFDDAEPAAAAAEES